MHVSLDSALGRQRRLNSVGESALQIAPSAAAAYSLRSLTGGDPKVVRVRRKSDNAERDFTASGVTSGALTSFVNEDVTIYQSDYSADANGWSGSTSLPTGNHDGVSDSAGTSKDNVLKLVKQADSQGYMQRDQGVVAGLTYTVSGSFFAPASNTAVDGIAIKDGVAGSSLSDYPSGYLTSDGTWTDFSFSYTATAGGTQRVNFGISSLGSNPNGSSTGSSGDIVYIADLKFVETISNGFVETWYDQSGNGRDSTNTTAAQQPIIVEAGVFQDGLKFTHTDTTNGKRLFVPRTAAELGQAFALVWVGKVTESDTSFNNLLGGLRGVQSYATGNTGIAIKSSDGTVAFINEDATTSRVKSDSSTTATLNEDFVAFATYEDQESGPELTFQVDAGNQFFSFGSAYVTTATKDIGIMNATANSGAYRTQESPTGICREVLVYDTHQGDNRVALVDNINNQYNLF